jgi:hypothetical protein
MGKNCMSMEIIILKPQIILVLRRIMSLQGFGKSELPKITNSIKSIQSCALPLEE